MQAKVLAKALTLALVVGVPVLSIAFLRSPFTSAGVAGGATTQELALPAPSAVTASEPVAKVQGEDQSETVLDSWTYTRRPISVSR